MLFIIKCNYDLIRLLIISWFQNRYSIRLALNLASNIEDFKSKHSIAKEVSQIKIITSNDYFLLSTHLKDLLIESEGIGL